MSDHNEDDVASQAKQARSEIAFVYISLEEALAVARAVANGGGILTRDQVAGALGITSTSVLNSKIAAARTFQLVRAADGSLSMTTMGRTCLSADPNEAARGRRDAFLSVALFRKTWEQFRGQLLPSKPSDLERAFANFGVAPKQTAKARAAFERSAQYAGFFHAGRNRLVEPILNGPRSDPEDVEPESQPSSADEERTEQRRPLAAETADDPMLKGLLGRLPPLEGKPWPAKDRVRWLNAFSVMLTVLFREDDEPDGAVIITLRALSAPNRDAPQAAT